jgi:hypothetical protein
VNHEIVTVQIQSRLTKPAERSVLRNRLGEKQLEAKLRYFPMDTWQGRR